MTSDTMSAETLLNGYLLLIITGNHLNRIVTIYFADQKLSMDNKWQSL